MKTRSWLLACAGIVSACSSGGPPAAPRGGEDLLAQAGQVVRTQSVPLRGIEPDGDLDDLDAFGRAVGERPIVILGEASHGDANTFKLKARLVRYLHEKKGFDLLLIESGLFDVARIHQRRRAEGRSFAELAPGRVFYMYSQTPEGRLVLDYAERSWAGPRPLALEAYDITMGGLASASELVPRLREHLVQRGSALPAASEWPAFAEVAAQAGAMQPQPAPDAARLAQFRRVSDAVDLTLCASAKLQGAVMDSCSFWCRTNKSVRAGAERLWGPRPDPRDFAAADNTRWLMEQMHPGKKVVMWMHSGHAFAGLDLPEMFGAGWKNVGTVLAEAGRDRLFIVHITAAEGEYDAQDRGGPGGAETPRVPPATADTIEHHFAALGRPAFLAYPSDAASRRALEAVSVFELDYRATRPHRFGSGYDGLFFVPTTRSARTDRTRYPVVP